MNFLILCWMFQCFVELTNSFQFVVQFTKSLMDFRILCWVPYMTKFPSVENVSVIIWVRGNLPHVFQHFCKMKFTEISQCAGIIFVSKKDCQPEQMSEISILFTVGNFLFSCIQNRFWNINSLFNFSNSLFNIPNSWIWILLIFPIRWLIYQFLVVYEFFV